MCYPGLGDPLAERYMDGGFGGMLSFDVRGDARKVETSTRVIVNATSLGGVTSLIESRYRWEGDRVPDGGEEDVAALLADIDRTLPPLKGVFHAAMVLEDSLLVNLDRPLMRRVLAPKLNGTWRKPGPRWC